MSHHILTLNPTDVLFFRDGRPMEGSSSGHGAAWPMPNVLNSALNHALRRAQDESSRSELHRHTPKRSGCELGSERVREFGSLKTAGPFPVNARGSWLFPRPADADRRASSAITYTPLSNTPAGASSSLHPGLKPVTPLNPPSKAKAEPWWSAEAYKAYLTAGSSPDVSHYIEDADIFAAEHNIGIGIDPATGSQDGESFYSASYLRLKEEHAIGMICECLDRGRDGGVANIDLIARSFPNSSAVTHIIAGGQQRTCSVIRETPSDLPLPRGVEITGTRVRWVLLTPAIFPHIAASEKNPTKHPGGWLPSWIHAKTLEVCLKDPAESARRAEGRIAWRKRVAALPAIDSTLVAATVPRAIPVTGWALHDANEKIDSTDAPGGARATHLAVPAGSVYYFECGSKEAATQLATALNWHHAGDYSSIANRRSTVLGEKGFGLGSCSNW